MRLDTPCPRCGRPIGDTGYVCADCITDLQARLREAAGYLEHGELDLTVGRQTRTSVGVIEPKPVDRAVYAGPWCYGGGHDCGHPSCRLVWYSIAMRDVDAGGRLEDPLPNESAGIINFEAAETRAVVDNTARAWALFVQAQRGTTVPVVRHRARRLAVVEPPELPCACGHPATAHPMDTRGEARTHCTDCECARYAPPRIRWCIWGGLPFEQCGCGREHQEEL